MISVSSPTKRAIVKTGIYTGNGIDDRDIDIGVDLASKENAYVIVKGAFADWPMHRIEYAQGDLAMVYNNMVDLVNMIQAFVAVGFQVGTDNTVNTDTVVYRYIVFWEEP